MTVFVISSQHEKNVILAMIDRFQNISTQQ